MIVATLIEIQTLHKGLPASAVSILCPCAVITQRIDE
jgi:hypothetical protein